MTNTCYGYSGEPSSIEFQRDLSDRNDGGDSRQMFLQDDRRWFLDGDGNVGENTWAPLRLDGVGNVDVYPSSPASR